LRDAGKRGPVGIKPIGLNKSEWLQNYLRRRKNNGNREALGLGERIPIPIVVAVSPLEWKVMRKLCAIAFIVMISAPLPAIAYTQEDASACTSDAMRLCQQAIPDEHRVGECLHQNKRQLSPACAIVFSRPRPEIAAREHSAKVHKSRF
jgi:hypothetical protein